MIARVAEVQQLPTQKPQKPQLNMSESPGPFFGAYPKVLIAIHPSYCLFYGETKILYHPKESVATEFALTLE